MTPEIREAIEMRVERISELEGQILQYQKQIEVLKQAVGVMNGGTVAGDTPARPATEVEDREVERVVVKVSGTGPLPRKSGLGLTASCVTVLRMSGRPLRVPEIIEQAKNRLGKRLNYHSVSSILTQGKTRGWFVRVAPGVYRLGPKAAAPFRKMVTRPEGTTVRVQSGVSVGVRYRIREALAQAGRPMSIKEILDELKQKWPREDRKEATLRTAIGANPDWFHRVRRGVYQLKAERANPKMRGINKWNDFLRKLSVQGLSHEEIQRRWIEQNTRSEPKVVQDEKVVLPGITT